MKYCLLIIPRKFYSFEKNFTGVLEENGYKVIVSNDEYPANMIGKLMGKLRIPLLLPITKRVISNRYLKGKKYHLTLIFKGRGINESLIREIKEVSDKVVGYNWDSFRFNKAPLRWYKYASRYCTFDFKDAENYGLPVVELFTSQQQRSETDKKEFELSAIIRNHSGRLRYLDRVLNILNEPRRFVFIFEQNIFFFLINFFSAPLLYLKYWRLISFKPLEYKKYSDVLRNSRYTIDFAHPYQTGITMRCFEAISAGTRIITNNPDVIKSEYFSDSNTIVFPEGGDSETFISAYNRNKDEPAVYKTRTISDFMSELIEK